MNRSELQLFFKNKLEEFSKIDSRIGELRRKLTEVDTMPDDSLIQLNMGICIFSVDKAQAIDMLTNAIATERNYHIILNERFHAAVGVMLGETS